MFIATSESHAGVICRGLQPRCQHRCTAEPVPTHQFHVGVLALWKGVVPAMARGLTYGGLRIGLYTPIKDSLSNGDSISLQSKLAAGCLSGGLAAAITNPIELVRFKNQAC